MEPNLFRPLSGLRRPLRTIAVAAAIVASSFVPRARAQATTGDVVGTVVTRPDRRSRARRSS